MNLANILTAILKGKQLVLTGRRKAKNKNKKYVIVEVVELSGSYYPNFGYMESHILMTVGVTYLTPKGIPKYKLITVSSNEEFILLDPEETVKPVQLNEERKIQL